MDKSMRGCFLDSNCIYHGMSIAGDSRLQLLVQWNTLSLPRQVRRRSAARGHSYSPGSMKNQLLVPASASFYLTNYRPDT